MKKLILSISLLFSATAMAETVVPNPTACTVKMENAALFEFAQVRGLPVHSVSLISFHPGSWTKALFNNTGYSVVLVGVPAEGMAAVMDTVEYQVNGRQIGMSQDCNITSIEKLEPIFIDDPVFELN